MDWTGIPNTGIQFLKKYRYALIVIAAGILLLTIPAKERSSEPVATQTTQQVLLPTLEESLSRILGMIDGAGKVEVLLTPARGEQTVYQTDDTVSSGEHSADKRSDTVLITGDGRTETGLIRQINPPIYQGAIIVCQGAGEAQVRLAVVQAVKSVTGLTADKITVLKMK